MTYSLSGCFSAITASYSASALIFSTFSEYFCCPPTFPIFTGFSSTGTTGGGGGVSSYDSSFGFLFGAGCSGAGFLILAAEGGLSGFLNSFFSGSGSPFPKTLFTYDSEDLPLVAQA